MSIAATRVNIQCTLIDLQVVHDRGPILEETHYYPFGLTMAGISSKAAQVLKNNKKFNGYEFNDELDLNFYEGFYRSFDQQIGRFCQLDPRPTETESLYGAMGNNPVLNFDILGDTVINGQKMEPRSMAHATTLSEVIVSNKNFVAKPLLLVNRYDGPKINFYDPHSYPRKGVENSQEKPRIDGSGVPFTSVLGSPGSPHATFGDDQSENIDGIMDGFSMIARSPSPDVKSWLRGEDAWDIAKLYAKSVKVAIKEAIKEQNNGNDNKTTKDANAPYKGMKKGTIAHWRNWPAGSNVKVIDSANASAWGGKATDSLGAYY